MADRYNSTQTATMDQDARAMAAAGIPLGGELNAIWAAITAGAVGITALGRDVNAIAVSGAVHSRDKDTGPGTSLTFAWYSFRVARAASYSTIAAGSLMLASASTNYIEVDPTTLAVSSNTAGFTAGRKALWIVVAGVSTYSDSNVSSVFAGSFAPGVGGLSSLYLTTPLKTRVARKGLATIPTAAGSQLYLIPMETTVGAVTITKVRFVAATALAASDTNYVSVGLVNKGTGSGTTAIVDITAAANTTKATGGAALVAYTPRDLTIASSAVNAGDSLELTITVTGTLGASIVEGEVLIEMTISN